MVACGLAHSMTAYDDSFNIDSIKRVQRKATKLINELKSLPYEQRLKKLNLRTMRYIRLRGDMIETYKIEI